MQATSVTFERTFFLGGAGRSNFPESYRAAISWSLENETPEQAEEKAIAVLYEMAERERRRRYKYIRAQAELKQAEQRAAKNKPDIAPDVAAGQGTPTAPAERSPARPEPDMAADIAAASGAV